MEIPPALEAAISEKQQRAWEAGLIQGLIWYVNTILRPTRENSRKVERLYFAGKEYFAVFEGDVFSDGEYRGTARLIAGTGEMLFELSFRGYTEGSSPEWTTRPPSAQSAVSAFIEGVWVEDFSSYLAELKVEKQIEAESCRRAQEVAENERLEDLRKRFGL